MLGHKVFRSNCCNVSLQSVFRFCCGAFSAHFPVFVVIKSIGAGPEPFTPLLRFGSLSEIFEGNGQRCALFRHRNFFLLQALHGIKPSRVTSKVAVSQLLKTRKQKHSKHPNPHASDTNPPARIGVPRENKPQPEQKMSQRGGKPARIKSRRNCPSVQIKLNPGEKPRKRKRNIAPGGRKHAEIGRSKTTDIVQLR